MVRPQTIAGPGVRLADPPSNALLRALGLPAVDPVLRDLVVDGTKVTGTLTNFPVTLDLTNVTDATARPDWRDASFYDTDGARLDHQIEMAGEQFDYDGQWCWYNDPRAVCYKGALNKVYVGFIGRLGDICVRSLDTDSGATARFTLHAALETDDHDAPGLLVMPDGRIKAFYSKHTAENLIYTRTTTNPEDVSAWGAETTIATSAGACYPTPVRLSSEGTGSGRIYLFFRLGVKRAYITSDDSGATWSAEKVLLSNGIQRPYWTTHDNGLDRIDFLCDDGNVGDAGTTFSNIYHFYVKAGSVFKSDGTLISTLAGLTVGTGILPTAATKLYDHTENGNVDPWCVCVDPATGYPVATWVAYQSPTDNLNRYYYARFNGTSWTTKIICQMSSQGVAGTANRIDSDGNSNYPGGAELLRDDPNVVYVSQQIDAATNGIGVWEIFRYVTADGGATWTTQCVTQGSSEKNIRPLCPRNRSLLTTDAPEVFFATGRFDAFDNGHYLLRIQYWPTRAAQPILARIKIPSLAPAVNHHVTMRYDGVSVAQQANPYDGSLVQRYDGLGRPFAGATADFNSYDPLDLNSLAGLTLHARFSLTTTDANKDYIFSNFSGDPGHTAQVLARALSAYPGHLEVFVDTDAATVGGTFMNPNYANAVPTYVSTFAKNSDTAAPSSLVLTASAATTVGNRAILCVSVGSGKKVSSVVDSKGNTWAVDDQTANVAGQTANICSAYIGTAIGIGDTITITLSGAGNVYAAAHEFSGLEPNAPADRSIHNNNTGSQVTGASGATLATQQDSELVITCLGTGANQASFTAPAGFTERNPALDRLDVAHKTVAASTTQAVTWTWPTSTDWGISLVTYKARKVNTRDGAKHSADATYDTTNGLKLWLDGVLSSTVYAPNGTLSVNPANNRAFDIAADPRGPLARGTTGTVEDFRAESIVRADAWIKARAHDRVDLAALAAANTLSGTATLIGGVVTVPTTSVTAASEIFLTSQSDGGTPGFLRVSARTPGASFTIRSSNALDTSTVAWSIS